MFREKRIMSFICVLVSIFIVFSFSYVFANAVSTDNLALKKDVSASSVLTIAGCNYSVENAVDGDLDTSWYADPACTGAEISVDLGAEYNAELIKIYWGIYDYAVNYDVYSSTDGNNWSVISSPRTDTMYKAHYVSELIVSRSMRYIKVVCNEKNDWSYEIFEIEAYTGSTVTENASDTTVPTTEVPSSSEDISEEYNVSRDMNHAYLPYEWFSVSKTDSFINNELDKLEANSINYLFCDLGIYSVGYNSKDVLAIQKNIKYTSLARWIKAAHERGMKVSACVNAELSDLFFEQATSTATFGAKIKSQVVTLAKKLLDTGLSLDGEMYYCDGMHIDFEPFELMYQDYLVSVLTAVKKVTDADSKMLSLYSPCKNGIWSEKYLRKVVNLVDMICPALYDTNGPADWGTYEQGVTRNSGEYISLCKDTCVWYSDNILLSKNPQCLLSPTVPVYEDKKCTSDRFNEGFPVKNSDTVYYHLNYNEYTGEELESLQNGVTGINEAAVLGAHVYSAGIFYWPAFAGESGAYKTNRNPYYNFEDDISDWQSIWING